MPNGPLLQTVGDSWRRNSRPLQGPLSGQLVPVVFLRRQEVTVDHVGTAEDVLQRESAGTFCPQHDVEIEPPRRNRSPKNRRAWAGRPQYGDRYGLHRSARLRRTQKSLRGSCSLASGSSGRAGSPGIRGPYRDRHGMSLMNSVSRGVNPANSRMMARAIRRVAQGQRSRGAGR